MLAHPLLQAPPAPATDGADIIDTPVDVERDIDGASCGGQRRCVGRLERPQDVATAVGARQQLEADPVIPSHASSTVASARGVLGACISLMIP